MALTPSEDDCQPDYIKTDEEETPQEESIQNLDRLEDFAQRGKLKSPNWILVILGVLMVWQVKFLYMLTDEGSSYAIENGGIHLKEEYTAPPRHWENAKKIHWENAKKIHPDPQRLPKKKVQAPRNQEKIKDYSRLTQHEDDWAKNNEELQGMENEFLEM